MSIMLFKFDTFDVMLVFVFGCKNGVGFELKSIDVEDYIDRSENERLFSTRT